MKRGISPAGPKTARRDTSAVTRIIEWLHSLLPMHWDHESRMAGARTALSARTWLSVLRFVESRLSSPRRHRDHELLRLTETRSGARVCDPQHGRYMERLHCP